MRASGIYTIRISIKSALKHNTCNTFSVPITMITLHLVFSFTPVKRVICVDKFLSQPFYLTNKNCKKKQMTLVCLDGNGRFVIITLSKGSSHCDIKKSKIFECLMQIIIMGNVCHFKIH